MTPVATPTPTHHKRKATRTALWLAQASGWLLVACGGIHGSASPDAGPKALNSAPRVTALQAARGGDAQAGPIPVFMPGDTATGRNPPVVLNATVSARAGDVITLQGHNFGSDAVVMLSASRTPLEIVNRMGDYWLAAQLPPGVVGGLIVRVESGGGSSASVKLNGAQALHLDATQLVPGGTFRIFGRNLQAPLTRLRVTVDGQPAVLDPTRSDEHMITATAPHTLQPRTAAVVVVDNGNGTGPSTLDRPVQVVAAGGNDPFGLGVGWAAGFAGLATNLVNAATDPRLAQKMVCDGVRDDSGAVQAAIDLAASTGGGVVQMPAGRCRMASGMALRSRVVVQGAGKAATELVYESNYPVFGHHVDLAGVRNFTLTNAGSATEAPLLKESSRVFMQNMRVRLGTSRQMYVSDNRNLVMAGSDFEQGGSISNQGPYLLNGSTGVVFEGNTTRWLDGAPAFGQVRDAVIRNNRFTRDGANQNLGGTVHSLVLDFAYRVAVVGNTFDVANGPITNTTRNDGETILSEGGGNLRTENLGAVASAGSATLTDPTQTLNVDPFGTGRIPENYGVAIVAGAGAGQTRRVVGYAARTLTVDRPWDVRPDASSRYATFVWGLEKSLIKDNVLSQNPRGIWLYHAAMREIEVVGNTIAEGGGIYLRSYQNLATKSFMPMYNVLIARNKVSNSNGLWMSYINALFVNADARAFGIAMLGIEMRANEIIANRPNASSQMEEYANTEGFMHMMRVENYSGYESPDVPRLLGAVLSNNTCIGCEVAVRVGTGAGGTTILGTQLVGSAALLQDWATTSGSEKSTHTVIR